MTGNWTAIMLPLGAALLGNCLYHLASRAASFGGQPFSILAIVYALGGLAALILAVRMEGASLGSLTEIALSPWTLLLAAAVLMIEVGFLFAYRSGAPISSTSMLVNASVAVVLATIGVVLFKEPLDWKLVTGILLTTLGVVLIASSRMGVSPSI